MESAAQNDVDTSWTPIPGCEIGRAGGSALNDIMLDAAKDVKIDNDKNIVYSIWMQTHMPVGDAEVSLTRAKK